MRDHFAHQIFASNAEMRQALGELRRDLRRRQEGNFDALEADDCAAIVAGAARLDELEARAREKAFGILLQTPLRRHCEDERRALGGHAPSPHAASTSMEAAKPTAAIGARAPNLLNRPS